MNTLRRAICVLVLGALLVMGGAVSAQDEPAAGSGVRGAYKVEGSVGSEKARCYEYNNISGKRTHAANLYPKRHNVDLYFIFYHKTQQKWIELRRSLKGGKTRDSYTYRETNAVNRNASRFAVCVYGAGVPSGKQGKFTLYVYN